MDRRSFVSLLTAGTAGTAFATKPGRVHAQSAPKRLVVVGGGMAGATCAKYVSLWGQRSGTPFEVTLIDAEPHYTSCILSNGVLTGEREIEDQIYGFDALADNHGVRVVTAAVDRVDASAKTVVLDSGQTVAYDRLVLAPGIQFDYSQVSITGAGMTAEAARAAIPHAWKAGPQTTELRTQLLALQRGQHVIVTVPKSPYRCPPGPYERACVLADWLRRHRRGSRVIVLDENAGITAERVNFGRAFTRTHRNIDYYPNATIANVEIGIDGTRSVLLRAPAARVNPVTGATLGDPVENFEVAVLNYIPPHSAGSIVIETLASVDGGLAGGRWAEINELTYETVVPGIHVVGDSISSKQPKAGHIANQQAKVCADAILRLESGVAPFSAPVTNSACYTPITRNTASWLTAVFRYDPEAQEMVVAAPGVIESPDGATRENFETMNQWFASLMSDTYL